MNWIQGSKEADIVNIIKQVQLILSMGIAEQVELDIKNARNYLYKLRLLVKLILQYFNILTFEKKVFKQLISLEKCDNQVKLFEGELNQRQIVQRISMTT